MANRSGSPVSARILRNCDLSDTADLGEGRSRRLHGLADLALQGFDLAVQTAYVRYTRTRYARGGAFVASVATWRRRLSFGVDQRLQLVVLPAADFHPVAVQAIDSHCTVFDQLTPAG